MDLNPDIFPTKPKFYEAPKSMPVLSQAIAVIRMVAVSRIAIAGYTESHGDYKSQENALHSSQAYEQSLRCFSDVRSLQDCGRDRAV